MTHRSPLELILVGLWLPGGCYVGKGVRFNEAEADKEDACALVALLPGFRIVLLPCCVPPVIQGVSKKTLFSEIGTQGANFGYGGPI